MAKKGQSRTERLSYQDGQLLSARDLRDDVAFESRLRGLHVRALHRTWGVALGYEVYLSKQKDAVLIAPGVAYDCAGREISSSRTLVMELPGAPESSNTTSWWYDLLIRYNEGESRAAACCGVGSSSTRAGLDGAEEKPAWRWSFAGDVTASVQPPLARDVRAGEEIPLARFRMTAAGKLSKPFYNTRRHARKLVRPYIAGGEVRKGSLTAKGSALSWSVKVDTSTAGFSRVPFYFASLAAHPLSNASGLPQLLPPPPADPLSYLLGPFVSVHSPHRNDFTLEVRMPVPPAFKFIPKSSEVKELALPVAINWIGIESLTGCPPPLSLLDLHYVSGLVFPDPTDSFGHLLPAMPQDDENSEEGNNQP